MRPVVINVLIDLAPDHPYHRATVVALRHASDSTGAGAEIHIVPTDSIANSIDGLDRLLTARSAVVVGPGSPYTDQEAVHEVIRGARERGVPLVGT